MRTDNESMRLEYQKKFLESEEKITEKATKKAQDEIRLKMLEKDKLRKDAVIRNLEIIGEAAKNIPESFRIKYSIIEWKKIAGTRDKLSHGYFGVDLSTVWDVIKDDLPELKKNIEKILKDYNKWVIF